MARPAAERFWSRVDVRDPVECWPWTGLKDRDGYGRFRVNAQQKAFGVHRWAYMSLRGPIPEGLVIDHLCRVRHCVNPDHLEAVTNAENVRRGRAGYRRRGETDQ